MMALLVRIVERDNPLLKSTHETCGEFHDEIGRVVPRDRRAGIIAPRARENYRHRIRSLVVLKRHRFRTEPRRLSVLVEYHPIRPNASPEPFRIGYRRVIRRRHSRAKGEPDQASSLARCSNQGAAIAGSVTSSSHASSTSAASWKNAYNRPSLSLRSSRSTPRSCHSTWTPPSGVGATEGVGVSEVAKDSKTSTIRFTASRVTGGAPYESHPELRDKYSVMRSLTVVIHDGVSSSTLVSARTASRSITRRDPIMGGVTHTTTTVAIPATVARTAR